MKSKKQCEHKTYTKMIIPIWDEAGSITDKRNQLFQCDECGAKSEVTEYKDDMEYCEV